MLTEQVTLGGSQKLYSVQDIIFGYKSELIKAVNENFPPSTTFEDLAWQQGDAIIYSKDVAPILSVNTEQSLLLEITINPSAVVFQQGRVTNINGFTYPNVLREVLTGDGSSTFLPKRCGTDSLYDSQVYTWMQN